MRIEVVGFLTSRSVSHLHEVRGKHSIPLTINIVGKDRALVAPLGKILDRGTPHANIGTTIGAVGDVVRTDDVGTILTRIVRVLKHTGFTIGEMFPQRKVRILSSGHYRGYHKAQG
jgi:hypothetical protein